MTIRRQILYLLIIAALITGITFYYSSISPVGDFTGTKTIDITKGATFSQTTEMLYGGGLVKNRPFFWLLALIRGSVGHIRAGQYEFSASMSPSAMLDKLVRGEIKAYSITVPEGITYQEIARRFASYKLINETEFMHLATDKVFLASLKIKSNSIEGYLYPDAYLLDRSMTTEEVMRIMVGQFWRKITPELKQRAEEVGMSVNEWVTLASIICSYSGNKDEMANISAVFHNRMKKGMKLQSDPTVIYGLERNEKYVKMDRKYYRESDTPYNTYRISGLPPGPIANPDIGALRAALYPAKVDYLYIMAKKDDIYRFSTKK